MNADAAELERPIKTTEHMAHGKAELAVLEEAVEDMKRFLQK